MSKKFDEKLLKEWSETCQRCRYNHAGKECKEKDCYNCGKMFYGPYCHLCLNCEEEHKICPLCRKNKQHYHIGFNFAVCEECFFIYRPL